MVKKTVILLFICLVAAAVWYFFVRENPEKEIRKQITNLCETVNKDGLESAPKMAFKNEYLSRLMAEEVEIEGDAGMMTGKDSNYSMTNRIMSARNLASYIKLSFYDYQFSFENDRQVAVTMTARLRVEPKSSGERYEEVREVIAWYRKVDRTWKVYKFKLIKVLEK